MRLVTQAEAARHFGVTRQSINELVARRVIPMTDGKIDLELAEVAVRQRLDPARSAILREAERAAAPLASAAADTDASTTADDTGNITNYHVAKTLREKYEALKSRNDYRKQCGELVERAAVERALFEAARMMRDMVLAVPRRVAAEAVSCGDAKSAERIMTDQLRQALDEFSRLAHDGLTKALQ